jgi:CBS domain-containing protein
LVPVSAKWKLRKASPAAMRGDTRATAWASPHGLSVTTPADAGSERISQKSKVMKEPSLRVEDLMSTAVVTASMNETIGQADFDMRLAMIRHLPVVDDHGHLVGIVSDRDLRRIQSEAKPVLIDRVMKREVVTIRASAPAHIAAQLLAEHRIGALPVLGDEGQLVGVISEIDFLRIAWQALLGLPLRRT